MTYALVFLLVLMLTGSIWLNIVIIKKNLMLEDQRENLVDKIEESLDIIDDVHTALAHTSEIPVLSDEPVIREVVHNIKRARYAMLAIASLVVMYGSDSDEKDEG